MSGDNHHATATPDGSSQVLLAFHVYEPAYPLRPHLRQLEQLETRSNHVLTRQQEDAAAVLHCEAIAKTCHQVCLGSASARTSHFVDNPANYAAYATYRWQWQAGPNSRRNHGNLPQHVPFEAPRKPYFFEGLPARGSPA
jgi:hypothetical protein